MHTRLACDYYPNHVSPDQWPQDMERMRACGIDLFRLLCFDWSAIEPEEGVWRFDWVKQVIELADAHGIQVQLTIPTAGPPPWMMLKYPEITANGTCVPGFRREYCPSSKLYRKFCRTLAARIVEEVGGYPNIWGYQIDNELGFNISRTPDAHERWIAWLKQRHGSEIEALNDAWCLKFWSREYTDWSQVQWEHAQGSPESLYDFKFFYSDIITDFMDNILEVLREKAPGKVISTNYMANFDMIDYWRMSRNLDVVGFDYYKWIYTLEGGALGDDMMRSLKQKPHWRFESGCDACLPTEWLTLHTVKGWARGMAGDMRFPWKQFNGGSEQVLNGLIDAAGRTTRAWEATKAASEWLKKLPELGIHDFNARVAVVNNWSCGWACQSLHHYPRNYFYVVEGVYKSLFRRGVLCDVTSPEGDWSAYKVLFFPSHPIVDDALAGRIRKFVEGGGIVVAMPMSFTHTPKVQLLSEPAPGPLTDVFGATLLEEHSDRNDIDNNTTHLGHDLLAMTAVKQVEPLRYALASQQIEALDGSPCERWFSRLDPAEGTDVIARYANSHYAGSAAVTCRKHASGGAAWWMGTFVDETAQRELYRAVLDSAGIEQIPPKNPGVEVIPLRRHIIYLNFNERENREPCPEGTLVVGQSEGNDLVLPPYGFAVLER